MKKGLVALIAALGLAVCVSGAPATVERGTGVFQFDGYAYVECFGEVVHSVINAPFKWQMVVNPNGEYVFTQHFDNHVVAGYAEGMDSGTVWIRINNALPYVETSAGGGMTRYTFVGTFVSDTGPTIIMHENFQVSFDANGNLRVDRYDAHCNTRD